MKIKLAFKSVTTPTGLASVPIVTEFEGSYGELKKIIKLGFLNK